MLGRVTRRQPDDDGALVGEGDDHDLVIGDRPPIGLDRIGGGGRGGLDRRGEGEQRGDQHHGHGDATETALAEAPAAD